ncbi:MAG: hypothetical protein ABI583_05870 [Betaproteobacteria bacterium]
MLANDLSSSADSDMRNRFTLPRFSDFTVEQPSLEQFVLLSMMLHVLAIVLFGDTNGGGARRGEKMWGTLTVTVQALLPGNGLKPGSYVAALQPPVTPSPPALASPGKKSVDKPARGSVQVPAEKTPAVIEPAPPAQPPVFAMPPVIAKEVEKAETDFVVPKQIVDRVHAPPEQTVPSEPAPREAPPTPPSQVPVPAALTPPSAPVALPILERAPLVPMPAPVEALPREVPVASPIPTPASAPAPVPTPPSPVAAPSMPTPVTAPSIPVPAPATKPEPAPPKVVPEVAKPVVVAPEPKPREIAPPVVTPPAPAPTVAPAPIKPEREVVPTLAAPVEVKSREIPAPAVVSPPAVSEPPRVEAPKAPKLEREIATPAAAPPTTVAPPPTTQIRAPAGSPPGNPTAAERDLLKPRGDNTIAPADAGGLPTTPALGKAPGLDLDAIRRRAREINSGNGARTVFPFPLAPTPRPKSKEQQAFDKALKKNDCRDAYADMGLAAVVPLVISAVRDDGCKW